MNKITGRSMALFAAFLVACTPSGGGEAAGGANPPDAPVTDAAGADSPAAAGGDSIVSTNATVRRINVEGGCWVLEAGTTRVQPVEFADSLKIDGLPVYVVYRPAPDMLSFCQVAPLVRVDSIRRR